MTSPRNTFERLLAEDIANETRILRSELGVIVLLALMVLVYVIAS